MLSAAISNSHAVSQMHLKINQLIANIAVSTFLRTSVVSYSHFVFMIIFNEKHYAQCVNVHIKTNEAKTEEKKAWIVLILFETKEWKKENPAQLMQ